MRSSKSANRGHVAVSSSRPYLHQLSASGGESRGPVDQIEVPRPRQKRKVDFGRSVLYADKTKMKTAMKMRMVSFQAQLILTFAAECGSKISF